MLDSAACVLKLGLLSLLSTLYIIFFHCLLKQKLDVLEFSLVSSRWSIFYHQYGESASMSTNMAHPFLYYPWTFS